MRRDEFGEGLVVFGVVFELVGVAGRADDFLPGDVGALIREEGVAGAGGEGNVVVAFLGDVAQGFEAGAVKPDAVDVALDGRFLGGNKVDEVVLEVDCRWCINNFPWSRGQKYGLWIVKRSEVGKMIVVIVDDCVNVAIVRPAVAGVAGDEAGIFRDLEPSAIKGCNIDSSYNLFCALGYVNEHYVQDIAFPIRYPDQDLAVFSSPYYLRNELLFA